ncbi:hypothetical protein VTO73DRAFT_11810 [Trametes versicolor]
MLFWLLSCLYALVVVRASAPAGPWDSFNFAPKSRTVYPTAVKVTHGGVRNANALVAKGAATLSGNGSWIALDFGVEVGGLVSLNFGKVTSGSSIALSFTESPMFISPLTSDDSSYPSANMSFDGVLQVPAPLPTGFWTQPAAMLRGGYRYLTIVSTSDEPVTLSNVSCAISFAPHFPNLRDYSGYFFASDPEFHDKNFLTKVDISHCMMSIILTLGSSGMQGRTPCRQTRFL